jgi:membrane protease subunit HflK
MAWNQPGEDKPRPPPRGAPPDSSLDEILRRWQQRMRRLWRPGSGRAAAASVLLLVVVVVWLASGYYQIESSERGVVQRFGAYLGIEQPGHGWHWPWPIETMQKLNVTSIQGLDSRALMLTADQSLVEIAWSVQYRIADPVSYLFTLHDPQLTLGQSGETVVRALVAQHDMASLLSGDARGQVTADARVRIQQMLDGYRAGIKAQAAAQRQLADAQVYAAQTVANADGEAERFTQLAAAYAQSPEVTRSRLYIDTMETILTRSRKIVIDAKNGNGSMIYLPLDKLAEAVRAVTPGPGPGAAVTAPAAGAASAGAAGDAASPAAAAPVSGGASTDRPEPGERGRDRVDR